MREVDGGRRSGNAGRAGLLGWLGGLRRDYLCSSPGAAAGGRMTAVLRLFRFFEQRLERVGLAGLGLLHLGLVVERRRHPAQ